MMKDQGVDLMIEVGEEDQVRGPEWVGTQKNVIIVMRWGI